MSKKPRKKSPREWPLRAEAEIQPEAESDGGRSRNNWVEDASAASSGSESSTAVSASEDATVRSKKEEGNKKYWTKKSVTMLTGAAVLIGTLFITGVIDRAWASADELIAEMTDADFDAASPFEISPRPSRGYQGHQRAIDHVVLDPSERAAIVDYEFDSAVPIAFREDRFFITGNVKETASIVGIRAYDKKVGPPIDDTYIRIPAGSGGDIEPLVLRLDLQTGLVSTDSDADYFAHSAMNFEIGSRLLLTLQATNPGQGTSTWVYELELNTPDNEQLVVYLGSDGKIVSDPEEIKDSDRFILTSEEKHYDVVFGPDKNNQLALLPGVHEPVPF